MPMDVSFASIMIRTRVVLAGGDGSMHEASDETIVTAENIADLATTAVASYPETLRKAPYCVVSGGTVPDESFTSREHFVPEGLGYAWTKLPAGTGTCDRVNKEFGAHELEWLRFGPMGTFRPFFVGEGKNDPPEYHAPKKSAALLSMNTAPDGTFVISVRGDLPVPFEPFVTGSGHLTIHVSATDANATAVSLALHKMTLLALWLSNSPIVLDPAFDALRAYLATPGADNYRAYGERFVLGARPGVRFDFFIETREKESYVGGKRAFGLRTVYAVAHVHHMRYALTLVGEGPPDFYEGFFLRGWQPLTQRRLGKTELRFGFDSLRDAPK
jgi:hypothetical protein